MEIVKKEKIRCSFHPKEGVLRVNTEIGAEKELYCIECLMDANQTSDLVKSLKHIEEFVEIAANHYQSQKDSSSGESSEVPDEYQELIDSQSVRVAEIESLIEEHKKKVQLNCDEITKQVVKYIHKKKDEQIAALDKQIFNYRQAFIYFEKQMKRAFKTGDDYNTIPSKEDIVEKFEKLQNYTQMLAYVRSIKEDLNEKNTMNEGLDMNLTAEEARRFHLKRLLKEINEVKNKLPDLKF